MSTKSGTMPRYLDELNEFGGLSGTDIANITDVSKATVSRWKSGTFDIAASPVFNSMKSAERNTLM